MSDAIKRVEEILRNGLYVNIGRSRCVMSDDDMNCFRSIIEERNRLEKHISDCRKGMIQFCWHSYADLDGNMDWPNNKEGDLIKAMYEDAIKDGESNEPQT